MIKIILAEPPTYLHEIVRALHGVSDPQCLIIVRGEKNEFVPPIPERTEMIIKPYKLHAGQVYVGKKKSDDQPWKKKWKR